MCVSSKVCQMMCALSLTFKTFSGQCEHQVMLWGVFLRYCVLLTAYISAGERHPKMFLTSTLNSITSLFFSIVNTGDLCHWVNDRIIHVWICFTVKFLHYMSHSHPGSLWVGAEAGETVDYQYNTASCQQPDRWRSHLTVKLFTVKYTFVFTFSFI